MSTGCMNLDILLDQILSDALAGANESVRAIQRRYPSLSEREASEIFSMISSAAERSDDSAELIITASPSFALRVKPTKVVVNAMLSNAKSSILITGYSLSDYFSDLVNCVIRKSQEGVLVKFFVNGRLKIQLHPPRRRKKDSPKRQSRDIMLVTTLTRTGDTSMSQVNDTTKKTICQHLNEAEREIIERQLALGTPKKQIARLLGRNISTIRREIKRGSVTQRKTKPYISKHADDSGYTESECYFSDVGQRRYKQNRLHCGRKCRYTECREFVQFVENKILVEKWSPDGAVAEAKRKGLFENIVSTVTIYNWIEKRLLKVKNIDLLQKCHRKVRQTYARENKTKLGTSIDQRPEVINTREVFAHWEGDSVVGKDGKSSVITLIERKVHKNFILKTEAKTAEATYQSLLKLKERLGENFNKVFRSITFDNGPEFAAADAFESLGIDVYYTHPYSAWERGQNEHFNGMLRRFIPKGKDLSFLTQDDLDRFSAYLNTLPRKSLGYSSPEDLFEMELSAIMNE